MREREHSLNSPDFNVSNVKKKREREKKKKEKKAKKTVEDQGRGQTRSHPSDEDDFL